MDGLEQPRERLRRERRPRDRLSHEADYSVTGGLASYFGRGVGVIVGYRDAYVRSIVARISATERPASSICIASRATSMHNFHVRP